MRKPPIRKAHLLLVEVLQAVERGLTMAQYARERMFSHKKARRLFRNAEARGFIEHKPRSNAIFWNLTRDGAELLPVLKTSLKTAHFKVMYRYEHCIWTTDLREQTLGFRERLKKGGFLFSKRRHFEGLQLKTTEATVFVGPERIWWLVKPIWAEELPVAATKGHELVLALVHEFEARYGVRLGYPERKAVLKRQEVALVAPDLLKFVPEGYYWRGDRLHLDHSHGPAELEAHDKAFAIEDMDKRVMPFLDSVAKGVLTAEDLHTLREFAETLRAVPKGVERRDIA